MTPATLDVLPAIAKAKRRPAGSALSMGVALSLALLVPAAPVVAGDALQPSVVGRVLDAATSSPVVNATIATAHGEATKTDADGRFHVDLPPGLWRLEVTAPGYRPASVDLPVGAAARAEVEVRLVPAMAFSETVNVQGPALPASDTPARLEVRPVEVLSVAGGGENVFRVLQTMPGVAGTDDFGSRLSVRGGDPDQNLTVMDGVEIHNPYRLFGLTSAFNPETVDSFELTAGAFSARYGDRLSSLLVVTNRAGSSEHAFTGSAGLSLTDANVILEGRLPKANGSWIVTGRRTYYDLVAERFTDSDLPSFNDLQARVVFRLGERRTLSLFGLRSREDTDAAFDFEAQAAKGTVFTRSRNDLVAVALRTPLGPRGWARTVASLYRTTDSFDFGGSFRDEERRSNAPDDSGYDTANLGVTWQSEVRDPALRQELGLALGRSHVLEAGFEVHGLKTDLGFTIEGRRNSTEANGSSLQGGTSLPDALDSARSDTRAGAWVQDLWQLRPRLSIEAGLRIDRSTINERTYLSPRVAATWALAKDLRLRGAFGVHRQSPGYEKLVQSDYFLDLTSVGPLALDSERARHVVLGLERDFSRGLTTRAEAYYKGFDRFIVGRLETPAETAARVARYDFPADLAGSVPTEPMVTTFPTNEGRGEAWGFDLYVARRAQSAETRLTGWGSYTFGFAERRNYGQVYPFDYDRRHALSLVLDYRVSRKVHFSAVGRLASGFPYTPVLGLVVAATPDTGDLDGDGDTEELVPQRDPSGLLMYQPDRGGVENFGTARLPLYARLDTRLTYTPDWGRGRVWLYLDTINVFNRKNAGMITTKPEYDPGSDRPRIVNEPDGALPFIPSLGIHVDFSRPRTAKPKASEASKENAVAAAAPRRRGLAVGLRAVGSDGYGVDAIVALSRRLGVRGTVGLPTTVTLDEEATATPYDLEVPLGASSVRLDVHPWAGRLRLSGGVALPRSPYELRAKEAATYDVGGVVYEAGEVTRLGGTASFRGVAPYLGIGWGSPVFGKRRFGFSLDVGVTFQGEPEVALSATGSAVGEPRFLENLARETEDVAGALRGWRTYPVISLSLAYRLR
jgi:outer membrane cobalamin receptor